MFQIGDEVFVHADGTIKLIPGAGPAAGQPFTALAAKSFSGEHNGKAIALMGNSVVPVSVALASAEPSWSVGLDVMQVAVDLAEHCGDGYARMPYSIVVTYTRPRLAPVTFLLDQCVVEKGFGFKSDSGGAPGDELSGKCRSIRLKYKGKIYDPFALPGGVSVA
ncbi:MAG: hypothetical protein IT372_42555 [Polyangiaceae bacterium]|nr:hypothetical protein [Polyangiaceae bacterium]